MYILVIGSGIDIMQNSFLFPLFSRFQNLGSINTIGVICPSKAGRIDTRLCECASLVGRQVYQ